MYELNKQYHYRPFGLVTYQGIDGNFHVFRTNDFALRLSTFSKQKLRLHINV